MTQRDEEHRRASVAEAARAFDFADTEAFQNLDIISNKTIVDTLEIFEEEIVFDGDRFTGPLLWHVTLQYGSGDDAFTSSDSFPGIFSGEFQAGVPVILQMTADTSSFYE